jgi:hypothetical protein
MNNNNTARPDVVALYALKSRELGGEIRLNVDPEEGLSLDP